MSDDLPDDPDLALARLEGQGKGRELATKYVAHVREHPETVSELVDALKDFHDRVAPQLVADGVYSAAEAIEWQVGFFAGVEPVVLTFLDEYKAAHLMVGLVQFGALAQRLADQQKPIPLPGLGGPAPRRPLRPEDFGPLPTSRPF